MKNYLPVFCQLDTFGRNFLNKINKLTQVIGILDRGSISNRNYAILIFGNICEEKFYLST